MATSRDFGTATDTFRDPVRVGQLLDTFGFTPATFLERFTVAGRKSG